MTYSKTQMEIFLLAVIIGVILAFIYDIIKIVRYAISHKEIYIYLEDAFFWLISTFVVFQICLDKNDGEIRLYFIIGIFIGMISYFFIVSPIVMSFAQKIIDIIKFIVKLFIEIVMTPLKLIYMVFGKHIVEIAKKYFKKILKILIFCKLCVKIKVMEFFREKQMIKNINERKLIDKKSKVDNDLKK